MILIYDPSPGGFRYATNNEVITLWNNFSIDLSQGVTQSVPGPVDPGIVSAISLVGDTFALSSIIGYGVLG